jgi:hypothetical protein
MKQRKIISLPSNQSKIYKQILAFMNFMLNLTPQERDVLAEIIKLDNEYSMLPEDKRAKFILSTDMRKEIRDLVKLEEKQFNVIISRLKKKLLFNRALLDDNNILHPELRYKPDEEGFKIEINFVMTSVQPQPAQKPTFTDTLSKEIVSQQAQAVEEFVMSGEPATPPVEYKHDAAKAPVLEEEEFDITIELPDE